MRKRAGHVKVRKERVQHTLPTSPISICLRIHAFTRSDMGTTGAFEAAFFFVSNARFQNAHGRTAHTGRKKGILGGADSMNFFKAERVHALKGLVLPRESLRRDRPGGLTSPA